MKVTESISDPTGFETLDVISKANRFNLWMYSVIQPFCQGNILEIGSGIGNISGFFLESGSTIVLSDINKEYCDYLKHKFGSYPNLSGIEQINLVSDSFDQSYAHLYNKFDTIFALNVLEHIENHDLAVQYLAKFLRRGGRMIILVPSYPFLYCRFDRELGHYRRYTRKSLKGVLSRNGNTIDKIFNFNFVGVAGWFLFGKLSGRKQIEQSEMSVFNRLVPLFKFLDFLCFRRIGLSTIVVATKSN